MPLKSMCSTKCAMPPRSAVSWREPRVSQTPMLTERTCVIRSVRMRRPLSRTSRTIGEFDKVKLAAGTRCVMRRAGSTCRKALTEKELPARHHTITWRVRSGASLRHGVLRLDGSRARSQVRCEVIRYRVDRPRRRPDLAELERAGARSGARRARPRALSAPGRSSAGSTAAASTDVARDDRPAARAARHARRRLHARDAAIVARERSADGTEKFLLRAGRRPPASSRSSSPTRRR